MPWYDPSGKIPVSSAVFNQIIDGFVFNCPSSIKHEVKDKTKPGKEKETVYQDVSARMCSFRRRGIDSNLLTTLLTQIRRPLVAQKTYSILKFDEDVEKAVSSIIATVSLADPCYDLIVYQRRSDMSDVEAIFYYIRNAFAHGSFEVKAGNGKPYYLLQSDKNNKVKAQMRLKESTLMHLLEILKLNASDIRSKQRKKKPKAQKIS